MTNYLQGKRIAITGASDGVGRETARLLAGEGARVFLIARRQEKLESAVSEIRAQGGQADCYAADVSKPEEVAGAFASVREKLGGLDALVNGAALPANNIFNTPVEEWQGIIGVNLLGYLYCAREAADLMRSQRSGTILNIGSLCLRVKDKGCDLYMASKAGVEGFTDSLRKELADDNILVTLLNPGQIASGMVSENESQKEVLVSDERMLLPGDVAEAIAFCLSQPSRIAVTSMEVRPRGQIGL
jgi:3-hydroxy acid dehydrogenase/malonic semialdehyde reductase